LIVRRFCGSSRNFLLTRARVVIHIGASMTKQKSESFSAAARLQIE